MECDFLNWNCSIAHRRSGARRELTHEPLEINNAEAPVQSAVLDGGMLVAASYSYRADPNEIGKMPAHVHALQHSTTARRQVQCSGHAANVWRPHSKRTANAQQARSKRAATSAV